MAQLSELEGKQCRQNHDLSEEKSWLPPAQLLMNMLKTLKNHGVEMQSIRRPWHKNAQDPLPAEVSDCVQLDALMLTVRAEVRQVAA